MKIQKTNKQTHTELNPLEKPILYKFSIKPHFQTERKHFMKDIFVLTLFSLPETKDNKALIQGTARHYSGSVLRLVVCVTSYHVIMRTCPVSGPAPVFPNETVYIIYGCFLIAKAELSSSNRDYMFQKD